MFKWIKQQFDKLSTWIDLVLFKMYIQRIHDLVNKRHIERGGTKCTGVEIIGETRLPINQNKSLKTYFVLAEQYMKFMFPMYKDLPLGLTMASTQYVIIVVNSATMKLTGTLDNAVVFHEVGHVVNGHFEKYTSGTNRGMITDIKLECQADNFAAQAGYAQQLRNILIHANVQLAGKDPEQHDMLDSRIFSLIKFSAENSAIVPEHLPLIQ